MNKAELIEKTAAATGMSKKDTGAFLASLLDEMTAALAAGEKVQLVGFGSFESKVRNARIGRNPRTKKEIQIPASRVPTFKAGKALKDVVAKPVAESK